MSKKEDINYRKLNDELETLLARLQSGDLEVDEAVEAYQKGMAIIKQLESYLKTAENTVKKLRVDLEK